MKKREFLQTDYFFTMKLPCMAVICLVTFFLAPIYTTQAAAIWYVKTDGSHLNGGTNWDDAVNTIHNAVVMANSGDEIWVKEGTYFVVTGTTVNRDVAIYAGFDGTETERDQRDWQTNVTVVDGQEQYMGLWVSGDAVIDGFTITRCDTGIYCRSSSTISNCTFSQNDSVAIHCYDSPATITNCTIYGNAGNGIRNYDSSPIITNCTIYGNAGNGIHNVYSSPTITNCILWGDTEAEIYNQSATSYPSDPVVAHCDIEGCGGSAAWNASFGTDGGGNIDQEPLFLDVDGPDNVSGNEDDNLHLQPGSPCIDAGTNAAPSISQKDKDKNPRIMDGDDDSVCVCDLGAYEVIGPICNTAPVACIVGGDRTLEAEGCETLVTLDGSCSSDVDSTEGTSDDIVSFDWYEGDMFLGSGETIDYAFPLGEHVTTLVVTDYFAETDDAEVTITVQDTTPPEVSVSVSKDSLKPLNHEMVDVGFTLDISDICDPEPDVSIEVTSDEPTATAPEAGGTKHAPDADITADGRVLLRAERSKSGDGRVYVITLTATDESGNSASSSVSVKANISKKREAVDSGQNYDATQVN